MTAEMKHLLKDLRPPTPPPELRERTLRAALDAKERKSRPDWWAQIWHSRPLRYAWATTVAGLLLAHALISATPQASPATFRAFSQHRVSAGTEEEIRGIAALLRLDLEARSLAGAATAAASQNTSESTAPIEKENA